MTPEEILQTAIDKKTPAERADYLEQVCGQDAVLRAEIEGLLRAHEAAGSFLEQPLFETPRIADEFSVHGSGGMVIGPYKLLEKLGEGGMGTVWMAQQTEPVRRVVALKLIKAGMDSKQVIARFEAERQALALMDHPNIAKVLDAGTTETGRPYFVMELVKGVPITKYCDEHRLTPRQRLELFIPVCQAVQHAHQKGIIHRDLKPSNVLIARYDDKPVPKVIDFGVAKATGENLTERTLHTGFGAVVGTLEYMSPEQASFNQLDVDTRSDIYSLGVLLYELLTGSPPFRPQELGNADVLEVLRMIREQEPTRPSTKLSTTEGLPTLAANRGTEPKRLTALLRGELDWIVMKALEKDRSRRYETANSLGRDLQRYLADEPVQACPPSAGHRLRQFVRRNRGLVLTASLVVLALVAGIVGTTWGMIRAAERAEAEHRAREEAQKRLAQIEKGTEILASVFRDLDPVAGGNDGAALRVLLGRRLGEAARQLEGDAVGDPLVVARLQHELGVSLHGLGHRQQAEELLVKASRTRQRLLRADHLDTAATLHHLAMLYREQGDLDLAEKLLKDVLAVRTAQLGAEHQATLTSQHLLAMLYHSQNRYTLAETLFKEVVATRTATLGADSPDTLTSQHRLALLYRSQGKFSLAEALHQEVLAIRTAKLGPDHLDTAATKGQLAALYHAQEKYAPAEALYQEVLAVRAAKLGLDHPDALGVKQQLATVYQAQEKHALAETLCKDVLAIRTAKLGADDPETLASQLVLAELYQAQGKHALAETLCREVKDVLATSVAESGADHPVTLRSRRKLAMMYCSLKKLDQSIPLFEEILKLRKAKLEPDHPDLVGSQIDLAFNYCDADRFADAIPLLKEVHRKELDYPRGLWVSNALLRAYVRTGKATEATALVTEVVQAARRKYAADSPELTMIMGDRARELVDVGAYAAAEPLLRESLALAEKLAADAWATHHTRALLGSALLGQQKYAEAEPFLVRGYEGLKERAAMIPPKEQRIVTTAVERVVQLYDAWDMKEKAGQWREKLGEAKKKPDTP